MKIVFTRHAREKLAQRIITAEMVRLTVNSPKKLITDSEKFHAFRKLGGKYLKVVFVRQDDIVDIITQYFVNSLP